MNQYSDNIVARKTTEYNLYYVCTIWDQNWVMKSLEMSIKFTENIIVFKH